MSVQSCCLHALNMSGSKAAGDDVKSSDLEASETSRVKSSIVCGCSLDRDPGMGDQDPAEPVDMCGWRNLGSLDGQLDSPKVRFSQSPTYPGASVFEIQPLKSRELETLRSPHAKMPRNYAYQNPQRR